MSKYEIKPKIEDQIKEIMKDEKKYFVLIVKPDEDKIGSIFEGMQLNEIIGTLEIAKALFIKKRIKDV